MQIYTTKNLRITNQPNQRGRWKQTYGNCTRQRFCVGYEYAPVSRVPLQFSFRLYIWTATMRLSTCRNQVLPELGTPLQHFEGRQRNTTVVSFCVHRCTHIHTCHTGMHWKARHFCFLSAGIPGVHHFVAAVARCAACLNRSGLPYFRS